MDLGKARLTVPTAIDESVYSFMELRYS